MINKDGHLAPIVLQVTGVMILIGLLIFWTLTRLESALLVGAALSLIGVGSASGAILTVRQELASKMPRPEERQEPPSTSQPKPTP